jgi:hypothetical protein
MTASALEPMRIIPPHLHGVAGPNEGTHSAVSWAAVAAGAVITAALGLILLALGAGAGLSSLSPWSTSGLTTASVGKVALLWIAGIEVVASGVGGYMAGRLRTKWVDVHSNEVYFRDTAHGFLSWAVALVVTAAFLTSAATAMVGGDARGTASARSDETVGGAERYYIDQLYRAEAAAIPAMAHADAALRAEAGTILAHSIRQREMNAADKSYLDASVAANTGLTAANADARVSDVFAQAQQAVNSARRAASHALYWLFVALLLGAFSASAAATLGGKERDRAHLPAI